MNKNKTVVEIHYKSFVYLLGGKTAKHVNFMQKSNRKAMNRKWDNQKANPALKTKTRNKEILQIDQIQ